MIVAHYCEARRIYLRAILQFEIASLNRIDNDQDQIISQSIDYLTIRDRWSQYTYVLNMQNN